MSNVIRLLPDNVANQIAAGEVVQRPASVVKELIENAIDAESSDIRVAIKDAGKTLIQVIDNGVGMSEVDARMSFEKHATSKIKFSEDLFNIHTMGFRGEALASIAAVAQLEMATCYKKEELGTRIVVEGTEIKTQEPIAVLQGTQVSVKNLFFNVPARRNFLKSNPVETKHIIDEFQRAALSRPDITFSFCQNDLEMQQLPATKLSHRIVHLFGDTYKEQLIPCQEDTHLLKLRGYIGKPSHAKKTRGEQFFFVNQRFIKSSYLNHAVRNAFKDLLPQDFFPFYVLFIEVDPQRIDVNVHPTKTEIKFEDERTIYSVLIAAIRHALASYHVTPSIDFEQCVNFNPFRGEQTDSFQSVRPSDTNALKQKIQLSENSYAPLNHSNAAHKNSTQDWKELFLQLEKDDGKPADISYPSSVSNVSYVSKDSPKVQLHEQYILAQVKSGILLIDQQAAHEQILYERYLQQMSHSQTHNTQKLLFPVHVTLGPEDLALAQEHASYFKDLGILLESFGKDSIIITGCPTEIANDTLKQLLEELIEQFKDCTANSPSDTKEKLARSLARRVCTKAGKRLHREELDTLVDQLFACTNPNYTPKGHQIFVTLTLENIASLFQK